MGSLDGLGGSGNVIEMVVAAVIGHSLVGPEELHDLEAFAEAWEAVGAVDVEGLEFVGAPAEGCRQDEPATSDGIQGGDLFGQGYGVIEGQQG